MARELLKDLIYGEQLVSDGCKVDFAVGLTYSLNLETMLTVPLAFGDLGELDDNVKQNPAFLLEGIRRSGDKIALFCNKGSIQVPDEARTVFSLLERSIFEVKNDTKTPSNFHPKLWLVKETDKDGVEWLNLSVMSRNLEYSTCLDICCSLRGKIGKRRSRNGSDLHKPLKDMLIWVSNYATKNKANKVVELAELLDYVDHFDLDEPFDVEGDGYEFFPFVFGKDEFNKYNEPLNNLLRGERILVVSPFIDVETLSRLTGEKTNKPSKQAILITRYEYVTQEVLDLFDEVWVANDTMIDNTTAKVDLHAKMYLTQRYSGENTGYTLYLGSANATKNAFLKNAEFLLALHYKRTTSDQIKMLLDEMVSDNRFTKINSPNPNATNERLKNDKELLLKKAADCLKEAIIENDGNELYRINLKVKGLFDNNIQIRPLQCKDFWKTISQEVTFENLSLFLLSEFYVLRIATEDKAIDMVVKVKTKGMPDGRDNAIFQSIVTKKEELLDYVAFMLSDAPTEYLFEQQLQSERNLSAGFSSKQASTLPLYEQLLKTASKNPQQIAEVQTFVTRMKQDIVPDELKQILDKFKNVSKQIAAL